VKRRVAAAAILLLVGGCATGPRPQPIEGESARRDALQALASWTLRGRVAVAAGSDGFSGGLQWQQLGPNAELTDRRELAPQRLQRGERGLEQRDATHHLHEHVVLLGRRELAPVLHEAILAVEHPADRDLGDLVGIHAVACTDLDLDGLVQEHAVGALGRVRER